MNNKITITKKIAKQGRNSIIVIPACLRDSLKAGSLVQIEITPLGEGKTRYAEDVENKDSSAYGDVKESETEVSE